MLERIVWKEADREERERALRRPALSEDPERERRAAEIVTAVRVGGDEAVLRFTERFDGRRPAALEVEREALERAWADLDPKLRDAMEFAPAGTAPLPSTVLMTAIPAKIAGCPLSILAAPPGENGEIPDSILAAARLCGVDRVFRMGGAQAIAAMAYGTGTVPKVDKIFGPGNAWVAEAKRQVAQDPSGAASDMPAGPSEVMVAADSGSDPAFAAADLLSQAEHGEDSQAVLVAFDAASADAVVAELERQIADLPRGKIAAAALSKSLAVIVDGEEEALEVVEAYAPEHLILLNREARSFAERVRSAGSVFVGAYSPEAAGDYAAGTNHVLPTYGAARAWSGLGVEAYMRWVSIQDSTQEGLEAIAGAVEALAECEGLEAHRRAVAIRRVKASAKRGIR
jgi:histidinol dehydrogenase